MKWAFAGMASVLAWYMIEHYTFTMTRIAYVPHYKYKDCFQFDTSRGPKADGFITMVGETEYTVMLSLEANHRYRGNKQGYKYGIKYLDEYTHHVKCPLEWGTK